MKVTNGPLDPDDDDEHDAAGGAPPPPHLLMAWIRYRPSAVGKSPVASSWELTPPPCISIAKLHTSAFSLLNKSRRNRHADAGEGLKSSSDPKTRELRKGGISTAELREALPPKGTRSAATRRADRATASIAPPTGLLDDPTLYTSRRSTIPRPPAAATAAGDRGIGDLAASEVDLPESFRNSFLPTVAEEKDDQALFYQNTAY